MQLPLLRDLAQEIEEWKKEGLRLVWLKVPLDHADLIPVAVERNFEFHHSAPDYLMLTLSVEPDAFIPHFATHYIGAGGAVIDEDDNLLVVSERHRRDKSHPYWKLPGRRPDPGRTPRFSCSARSAGGDRRRSGI